MHLAYILEEPFPTFVVNEILELRHQGVRVTAFNTWAPRPQNYRAAEHLRQESHYQSPRSARVAIDTAIALCSNPHEWPALTRLLAGDRLPGRSRGVGTLMASASYARRARRLGVDHIHAHFATTPATVALFVSRLSGIPFSFTCHAYDVYVPNPALARKVALASFVRCISTALREFILRTYPGGNTSKLLVRYLGVDVEAFKRRAPAPGAPRTIVAVARLVPMKGLEDLIAACEMLRNDGVAFRCAIAGEGPLRSNLQAQIDRCRLGDCVRLMGHQSPENVMASLEASHIFALPCTLDPTGDRDGLPVAIMEAMAFRLPVVSTPMTGVPEIVEDGESGVLVPERNPRALADALARLIRDAEFRAAMGLRGRQIVEARFDIRENVQDLVDLFHEAR